MPSHWAEKPPKVEAAGTPTLNTADTVWKEDPFFFPPFLLPPESPRDRETEGVSDAAPDTVFLNHPSLKREFWFSFDITGLSIACLFVFTMSPNYSALGPFIVIAEGMG